MGELVPIKFSPIWCVVGQQGIFIKLDELTTVNFSLSILGMVEFDELRSQFSHLSKLCQLLSELPNSRHGEVLEMTFYVMV